MSRFTYADLAKQISEMPADRQQDDVSILYTGEVVAMNGLAPIQSFPEASDILDADHMVLFNR